MKDSQGPLCVCEGNRRTPGGSGAAGLYKEHSETEGETMIIGDSKRLQDTPRYSLVGRLAGKKRIAVRK